MTDKIRNQEICYDSLIIKPYEDTHSCQLPKGHKGLHQEAGVDNYRAKKYLVKWRESRLGAKP